MGGGGDRLALSAGIPNASFPINILEKILTS